VATVLLVRHGRTTANAGGVLAGWTPGIGLDEVGHAQASALRDRLAGLRLVRAVSSPLQRCLETAALVLGNVRDPAHEQVVLDERLGECRYGDWTGRPLVELATEPLWRTVQGHPSAATFPGPGGESVRAMQYRAVTAVREHDEQVTAEHGPDALWMVFSHGDIIKVLLAEALGVHLDLFQRIVVGPASVSVVRYTPWRPLVLHLNDTGSDLRALAAGPTTAVVGGGDIPEAGARHTPPDQDTSSATASGTAPVPSAHTTTGGNHAHPAPLA